MTTRFTAGGNGVPSGYESPDVPTDFEVPKCGIEDVDRALFKMFDKEIKFQVADSKTGKTKKVPVFFASGERWALIKRAQAVQDVNNTFILPLITIRRVGLEQNPVDDITGRGINQQTGELVVKRRLSPKDRVFQSLVNKLNIQNQSNIANSVASGSLATGREQGLNAHDQDVLDGGLLNQKFSQNVWEVITIPSPQFFKATYEVIFWTQYTTHMNQILQKLLASYLPTGNGTLRLDTPQGYWFVATVDNNIFTPEDNFEDFTDAERIIKYKTTIKVPGYLVGGGDTPGLPAATRRFVSAPTVSFQIGSTSDIVDVNVTPLSPDPLSGSNDPTDPFLLVPVDPPDLNDPLRRAYKDPIPPRNSVSKYGRRIVKNPFTGTDDSQYIRVVSQNAQTGETVFKPDDGLTFVVQDEIGDE